MAVQAETIYRTASKLSQIGFWNKAATEIKGLQLYKILKDVGQAEAKDIFILNNQTKLPWYKRIWEVILLKKSQWLGRFHEFQLKLLPQPIENAAAKNVKPKVEQKLGSVSASPVSSDVIENILETTVKPLGEGADAFVYEIEGHSDMVLRVPRDPARRNQPLRSALGHYRPSNHPALADPSLGLCLGEYENGTQLLRRIPGTEVIAPYEAAYSKLSKTQNPFENGSSIRSWTQQLVEQLSKMGESGGFTALTEADKALLQSVKKSRKFIENLEVALRNLSRNKNIPEMLEAQKELETQFTHYVGDLANRPQDAFNAVAKTLQLAKTHNVAFDFQHGRNTFWDGASQRFGFVDLHTVNLQNETPTLVSEQGLEGFAKALLGTYKRGYRGSLVVSPENTAALAKHVEELLTKLRHAAQATNTPFDENSVRNWIAEALH